MMIIDKKLEYYFNYSQEFSNFISVDIYCSLQKSKTLDWFWPSLYVNIDVGRYGGVRAFFIGFFVHIFLHEWDHTSNFFFNLFSSRYNFMSGRLRVSFIRRRDLNGLWWVGLSRDWIGVKIGNSKCGIGFYLWSNVGELLQFLGNGGGDAVSIVFNDYFSGCI